MAGPSVVTSIGFGLYDDKDNEREGTVEVLTAELFNGEEPAPNGVYDARMGSPDYHYRCAYCRLQKGQDPGHPGRLTLRVPLQQPLAVDDTRRWLRVICLSCGHPVVNPANYAGVPAAGRLAAAALGTPAANCPRCKAATQKVEKDKDDNFTFFTYRPSRGRREGKLEPVKLYPHVIRRIFERVSDQTVRDFGKNPALVHPRKFIVKVVRIPPVTIRPGVRIGLGAGSQSYNDLTTPVQYLVKRNAGLPERLTPEQERGEIPVAPRDSKFDLDRAITSVGQIYYDLVRGSSATSALQGSGGKRGLLQGTKPLPSILGRLARKEGRLRRHLLGKRVLSISRDTISGNPTLGLDEVGYPQAFARTLQIRETVREYNREWLMPFFLNGTRQYPGSTIVVKRSTGAPHAVDGLRRDFALEVGDVLYRDLVTGDVVMYNRQPSLERSSIGAHRIVVLEDPRLHTFQMNVASCDWYGADQRRGPQQVAARRGPTPLSGGNSVSVGGARGRRM